MAAAGGRRPQADGDARLAAAAGGLQRREEDGGRWGLASGSGLPPAGRRPACSGGRPAPDGRPLGVWCKARVDPQRGGSRGFPGW